MHENLILTILMALCLCLVLAACSKDKQVSKVRIIASDEAGLDATIIIKSKAGEYTTVENKRNIFSYDKELDVMPGDSVMCYMDYAVSSTFRYEIKADGKLVQTKSIAPMQAPMYTRKNILFGYLVAD